MIEEIIKELELMEDLFVPYEFVEKWVAKIEKSDHQKKDEVMAVLNATQIQIMGKPHGAPAEHTQVLGRVSAKERLIVLL